MTFPRRGFALLIVLGLLVCFAIWIASLSWTMTNSRNRFQTVIRQSKAHFMARSALQHFFLKVKTMQRSMPEAMVVLEEAPSHKWGQLSQTFVDDILPPEFAPSAKGEEYGISSFTIGVIDRNRSVMTMEIAAEGTVDGYTAGIRRIQRITR